MMMKDLNNLKILAKKYTSVYDVCRIVRREALYGDNKSLATSLLSLIIPNIKDTIISDYIQVHNIKEEITYKIREATSLIDFKSIVLEEAVAKELYLLKEIENNLKEVSLS